MAKAKKYLVLGANGLIGRNIVGQLEGKGRWVGTYYRRAEPGLVKADITSADDLKRVFEMAPPDCVVNCANLSGGVDFCEHNPDLARKFHLEATTSIGELCRDYSSRFIFISTDYVFDGRKPPYKEDDPKNPLNSYGSLKLQAEQWLEANLSQYTIVRTTNVFGWDPLTVTPNFLMGIYRKLKAGEEIKVPSYLWGNPTYVVDLAKAIIELSAKGLNGVFHVVGSSFVNRYDWAQQFCDRMEFDKKRVIEIKDPVNGAVPRPLISNLNTDKFRKACQTPLHTVAEGNQMFADEALQQGRDAKVMTMGRTDLTVLMTVRNGEPYLHGAVASILGQTYRNFRFLILDNASADNSRDIVRSFGDSRVDLIELPEDIGQVAALNRGLAMIDTPFVARMDADDISLPRRLEREMAEIQKAESEVAVIGCWMQVIDRNNQPGRMFRGRLERQADYLFSLLDKSIPLYHPAVLLRRSALMQVGEYDVDLHYAEDFDLWERLALAGYYARVIPEMLCYYRVHDEQQSVTQRQIQRQNALIARERMIEEFADGYSQRIIRMFFETNKMLWQEVSSASKTRELIKASQLLLTNIQHRLKLSDSESARMRKLLYNKAGKVAVAGASLSNKSASLPLYLFAIRGNPWLIWRSALMYPAYYLASPLVRILRSIKAKVTGRT
jgi:dTDP-4-dehydrorhamnose reductase